MERKILILANHFVTLFLFRRELIERLLAEGNEVILSLPEDEKNRYFAERGCKVISTPMDRHGKNPLEDIRLFRNYEKMIRRTGPDVVLTYTIKPNVYGGMACARAGVPYIANITGLGTAVANDGAMQKLTLTLYRMGLRKAEKVFFQNRSNADFMLSHHAVRTAYDVLPGSGVDLETNPYEPYPPEDGGLVFLTIGRVMRDKGTDELLAAARKIKEKHKNVTFRLLGFYDGDYKEKVDAAVKEGVVEYLGQQDDVHACIKASHATIHPSYHEGMSNVLLESAAAGRPVLASSIPGCRETFDEGVSGIGFESKNIDDLLRAIERFIALPHEKKAAMGKAGREKTEREFDREIVVGAYLKEIHKIEDSKHAAI